MSDEQAARPVAGCFPGAHPEQTTARATMSDRNTPGLARFTAQMAAGLALGLAEGLALRAARTVRKVIA